MVCERDKTHLIQTSLELGDGVSHDRHKSRVCVITIMMMTVMTVMLMLMVMPIVVVVVAERNCWCP